MAERPRCAACGKLIARGKGLEVTLWDAEGVVAVVCSEACRTAYAEGALGDRERSSPPRRGRSAPSRVDRETLAVLGLGAAAELALGLMGLLWLDPVTELVHWAAHLAVAAVFVVLAVALARGRGAARTASLAIALLATASHAVIAMVGSAPQALVAPASIAAALALLRGTPGLTRRSAALAVAGLIPVFVAGAVVVRARELAASARRIERVALRGRVASSGPGGIRVTLAEGWRALRRNNGIIDWPHSAIEAVHVASGAAAFVVINPDCDRESLPEFSRRSIDALGEAGVAPSVAGGERLTGGALEVHVLLARRGAELTSFDYFDELRGPAPAARPGCVWLHCLTPERARRRVRADCREMLGAVERL